MVLLRKGLKINNKNHRQNLSSDHYEWNYQDRTTSNSVLCNRSYYPANERSRTIGEMHGSHQQESDRINRQDSSRVPVLPEQVWVNNTFLQKAGILLVTVNAL